MTRLHQALERVKEISSRNPDVPTGLFEDITRDDVPRILDFWPDAEPAEDPPASIRRSTVTDTQTAIAEPLALGRTTPRRCPECKEVQEGPLRGLWIRRFLGLMRIAPYRCRFCRHRFSDFDSETDPPETNQREGAVFSTFLRPDDNRCFNDLIRDIAQDEQEQSGHGLGSNASHGNERAKE